ncbi:MAG: mechanosensitive ion channel [Thiolinea sp.]
MGTELSADMFKDIGQSTLIQIALILISSTLIIIIVQQLIPRLSARTSGNIRYFLQSLIPMIRLGVIITAAVMILLRLIDPTFEKMVALFGGTAVALGFAFKDYISSLIGGIVTLFERPYRPGDWIEVNDSYGQVRAINMRNVEIVTPDDTLVYIPHLKLWSEPVHNANDSGAHLMTVTDFYLEPGHRAAEVRKLLYDVALTSVYTQLEKPILVIVLNKPWATHYRLKAYPVDHTQQFLFISDLTVRGQAALEKIGAKAAAQVMAATQPDGGAG